MAETITCPICRTVSPISVETCPECGANLARLQISHESNVESVIAQRASNRPEYSSGWGEDDLFDPRLLGLPWWSIVGAIAAGLALLVGILLVGRTFLSQWFTSVEPTPPVFITSTPLPLLGEQGAQTTEPTLFLPTLTPTDTPTATPSPTPTPGPCEQTVGAGDTLITLATRCGHRDLAIIDEIIQLNGLRSAESLQLGQVILIPWPTPTPGPASSNDFEAGEESSAGAAEGVTALAMQDGAGEPTPISDVIPTPTLQPGVMWYTVQPNDNIIKVAVMFNANVEILSQLNPEVTFSQCDFGLDYGGPTCIVQLFQGQRIRVPAPTPTPTLSPTPSGSETPTPTPTPTFNAPSLVSPGDRFLFRSSDLVTLRWVSTGMLGEGEVYLVTVEDTTLGVTYTATTTETFFIVPGEWQPRDGTRHGFEWYVAVGPADGRGGLSAVTFSTPARVFFWDSQ